MITFKTEKITDYNGVEFTAIYKIDGDQLWAVPSDLSNSDYQAYLSWLENPEAEQSTPIDTGDE